jgi:simple sugar transport system ATP-binding protein
MITASAHGVSKRFGPTTALDGVHLAIQAGEVHGLVGRNGAGKSTLVSVLTGLIRPDAGRVRFDGQPAPPLADRDAWRRRVACVYQKPMIIPELSVAENLFLNRQSTGELIDWRALNKRAARMLEMFGVQVKPGQRAAELTVEQRQLVEIARALSAGVRFVILDEPTAQLDGAAIDRLFASMRALREDGVTFLFISHHLDEVYDVCQNVTVLRDGRNVLSRPVDELTRQELIDAMTGEASLAAAGESQGDVDGDAPREVPPKPKGRRKKVPQPRPAPPPPPRETVLDVEELRLRDRYEGITFQVGLGEIVGLTGSASSGKVALAETVAGMRRPDSGRVTVGGVRPRPGPAGAIAAGIGFVPRDRHREGLIPLLSLAENATLPIADRLGRYGIVDPRQLRAKGRAAIADYDIQAAGPMQPVGGLSGGNAQKVVLARALAAQPKALVLINPTAGVDIRSKTSLLNAVMVEASRGAAVLLVSDELDDLRICDRVLVMHHGRIVLEKARGWSDAEVVSAVEGVSD